MDDGAEKGARVRPVTTGSSETSRGGGPSSGPGDDVNPHASTGTGGDINAPHDAEYTNAHPGHPIPPAVAPEGTGDEILSREPEALRAIIGKLDGPDAVYLAEYTTGLRRALERDAARERVRLAFSAGFDAGCGEASANPDAGSANWRSVEADAWDAFARTALAAGESEGSK